MGQQQLLLIVLGIIIVGVSVIVGINVFTANAVNAKRDNVTNDLLHLASEAQRYYKTPSAMGGGSRDFTGWTIPTILRTNADGNFKATVSAQSVVLIGVGNEIVQGNDSVEVKMTVTHDDYVTEIIH